MTNTQAPSQIKTSSSVSEGRQYAGVSLKVRTRQRKEQFLQAGLNLFGTTGFRKCTVRSLCKEANLTDRYFYQSYGSLEALLTSVYERCMTDLGTSLVEVISMEYKKSGAEKAIMAGLEAYFSFLEDSRVARVCMVELEGISPEVNALYYTYIDGFARLLKHFANHAYPQWKANDEEQHIFAISLIGAMRQVATNWLENSYSTDRKVLVSTTGKLFIAMMREIQSEK